MAFDYYEKGNFQLEVVNFKRAADSDQSDPEAWYYLGAAYEDVGEFNNAVVAYNKALSINPGYKDALHDLSLVYIATGKTDRARALLPRLVAADSGWGKELQLLISRIAP